MELNFKPDWFGGLENLESKIRPVNILEKDKYFEIELAIPGHKKEDFNINMDKNILSILAKKEEEKEKAKRNFTRRKFQKYSFERKFNLPKIVDEEGVGADYKNGILKFI